MYYDEKFGEAIMYQIPSNEYEITLIMVFQNMI